LVVGEFVVSHLSCEVGWTNTPSPKSRFYVVIGLTTTCEVSQIRVNTCSEMYSSKRKRRF